MWLITQQDKSDNYVTTANKTHSVKEFLELAFGYVGLDWDKYVLIDKQLHRSAEVNLPKGNLSKAVKLGLRPEVKFEELVEIMVEADLRKIKG